MLIAVFISLTIILPVVALGAWKAIMIRWQVWAFNNIQCVHELSCAAKIAGVQNGFIDLADIAKRHPDTYRAVKQKLDGPVIYCNDAAVPNETSVYMLRLHQHVHFYVGLGLLVLGIAILGTRLYGLGVMVILVQLVWLYNQYVSAANRELQFSLSDEGILHEGDLTAWQAISNAEVERTGPKSTPTFWLKYETAAGVRKVNIKNMTLTPLQLNHVLFVHRGRYAARARLNR
jgi:hypothetical protein